MSGVFDNEQEQSVQDSAKTVVPGVDIQDSGIDVGNESTAVGTDSNNAVAVGKGSNPTRTSNNVVGPNSTSDFSSIPSQRKQSDAVIAAYKCEKRIWELQTQLNMVRFYCTS